MQGTTITLSVASLLMLVTGAAMAAGNGSLTKGLCYRDESAMKREESQQGMFDAVKLTEQQRQQMRDLTRQVRNMPPPLYDIDDVETMYRLVTADKFDASAVRAQISRMAEAQIARQVEMARVRNQMYKLLTPDQKTMLNHQHEQNMQDVRQQIAADQSARSMDMFRQGQSVSSE
ncbi:cell-envelope stress modulator CpxP [Musicola keenii]|uniref:cell-envelope stress modulator CpxP n=1 Tax=Musicola keenii TaxID=2884250 RepID=UPI00177C6E33|nr:cell-envelope stress modulator CpxP [Musicola keenii]